MTTVLAVGGHDPSGCSGLAADLRTLVAYGVHGLAVVTAVTAQTSAMTRGVWPVPATQVAAQLDSTLAEIGADVVKTGMLADEQVVAALVSALTGGARTLVVDPVLATTGGHPLLTGPGVAALVADLLPLATVVTPNLDEACRLTGLPRPHPAGPADLTALARAVLALGPRWVLLTGGHLPGEPVDLLTDGRTEIVLAGVRVDTRHSRGTGCTLASALAAELALGADVPTAARRAKDFVTAALGSGYPVGSGAGPVNQSWAQLPSRQA